MRITTHTQKLTGCLLALTAIGLFGTVAAQSYPTRPLRMVVGSPAGGPVDIVGRIIAAKLTEVIGQQVIVDNRIGANGIIGADYVAKSTADGHTMIISSAGSITISPALYPKMPFDTLRDLAPVTQVTTGSGVLVVHPSLPAKSVGELISLARAKPGQLNFASGGNGSVPHMTLELLKSVTNIDVAHIPYSGGGPAAAAVVGGQVQGMFAGIPVVLPNIKTGNLRALGLASPQRSSMMPEVPTFAESGYPAMTVVEWYGILVPARTPPGIIARLHEAVTRAVTDPSTHAKLVAAGATPTTSTPAQFSDDLRTGLARWAKLVESAKIKID